MKSYSIHNLWQTKDLTLKNRNTLSKIRTITQEYTTMLWLNLHYKHLYTNGQYKSNQHTTYNNRMPISNWYICSKWYNSKCLLILPANYQWLHLNLSLALVFFAEPFYNVSQLFLLLPYTIFQHQVLSVNAFVHS